MSSFNSGDRVDSRASPSLPAGVSQAAPRVSAFAVAIAGLLLAYVAVGLYFVLFGRVNLDEGWYLYAARLVYEGRLPYRDFAFFQAPALPYVYGLVQRLFGEGLEAGRLTSFLLSLVTVGLGTRLAFELGGRLGALLFVAVILLTPLELWVFTTTRTEPLIAPLLMASAFCLLRNPPRAATSAAACATIALGVATRISLIPVALLVMGWTAYVHRKDKRLLMAVLLPGLLIVGAALAFALATDARAAWFDIVVAQADRHNQLQSADSWGFSQIVRAKAANLPALANSYGSVPVLTFGALGVIVAQTLDRRQRSVAPALVTSGALLALFACLAYVPNLAPRFLIHEYFAPVFPLFLVLVVSLAGDLFSRASLSGRRVIVGAAVGLLVVQAATFAAQLNMYTDRAHSDLDELGRVGRYLDEVVPPGATVVTMDTYLAVESGLPAAPGWEMSIFSYFPRRSEADGQRFHIVTAEGLAPALQDRSVGAVVLSDYAIGILVRNRTGGYRPAQALTESDLYAALPPLQRFRLARTFPAFGQFRDLLYVLVPKDAAAKGTGP